VRRVIVGVLACLALVATARAAEEVVDRIAAVAGRDVILQSEVDELVQLQLLQSGQQSTTPTPEQTQQMRCAVLKSMIDDRLLAAKARADSTIVVTPQQVEEALRQQLDLTKSRFPSEAAFQEELRRQGTTERDLRTHYRAQVERSLLGERLMGKLSQDITVSFHDLQTFYEAHRDSMPTVPATVTIAHITRAARPSDSSLVGARQLIAEVQRRLAAGADFGQVARDLSQDPGTAPQDGDLGWFRRGEMVPEFEAVAFSLDSGAVSGPVLTEFGLHLIQNLGYQDDMVHARHILARAQPTHTDIEAAHDTMTSIYQRLQAGADFGEMARRYSMDPAVQQTAGRVGPISPDDLPAPFVQAIGSLDPGRVSAPFETTPGAWHIVKLISRTREHQMNLADDRRQLEDYVRQTKLMAKVQDVLGRERAHMYIDVRVPDCAIATPPTGPR